MGTQKNDIVKYYYEDNIEYLLYKTLVILHFNNKLLLTIKLHILLFYATNLSINYIH